MIRKKILRENRIPGAESLTRPEEISEMSKYLGSLIDSKNSDLELDNRLVKVPGKSTGKIPEISELGSPVEKMLESFTNSDIKELDTKIRVGLDIEDSTFDLERESFRNSSAVKLDIADDREIKLSRHKEEVDIKDIDESKHYEEYVNSRRKELLSDKSNNGEPKLVDSSRKLISNQGAEVKKLDNKIESLNVDRVESLGSRKLEEILSDRSGNDEIKLEDEIKRLKIGEKISELPNKSSKLNIGNDQVNLSDFKDIVPGEVNQVSKLEDYRDDIDYSRDISLEDYIEGLGGELEEDKLSYYIDQLNTSNSGFDGKTLPDSMLTVPSGEFKEVAGNINSYKDELDTGDREVKLGTYISSLDVNSGFSGEELPDYSLTVPNNIDGPVELVDSALLVPGDIEEVELEDKIVNKPDDKFSTYLKDRLKDCLKDLNSDDEIFKFLMDLIAEGRNGGRNSSWEEKLGSLASSYLNTSKISPARVEEYLKELDKVLNVDVIGGRSGDILFDNRAGSNHFKYNHDLPSNYNKGYIDVEDAFNKKVIVLLEEEKKKEENKKEDPWSLRKAVTELTLEILVEKKLIERNKVTGDITLPGNNKYLNSLANTIVGIASGEKDAEKALNEYAVNTIKDAKEDVKKHIKESVLSGVSKYTGLATKKMVPLNKPLRDSVNKGIMKGANELIKEGEEEFDKFFNTSELEVLVGKSDYESVVTKPESSPGSNKSGNRVKINKLDKEIDKENKLKATYTTRNFFEDFWSCPAVQTTLQDLCIKSDSLNRGSSISDLKDLLKNSPHITTPSKFGTIGIANRGVQSLDVTSYWEVVLTPYVSTDEVVGNGGYSYLPCINEINLHNLKHHGVVTNYSSWIPFTSFNLQKGRLSSKQLQLYSGEINYPVGMDYMNELTLTIADDNYKSWKNYFLACAEASIFNSAPHTAEYYDSKNMPSCPTIIDKSSVCSAFYKNITFNIKIYILTPQFGTIRKFNFLAVLKDFSDDHSGDIDGSAPDVVASFSIVGELDEIDVPHNSIVEPEELVIPDKPEKKSNVLDEVDGTGEDELVGKELPEDIDDYFEGEVEGDPEDVKRVLGDFELDEMEVLNITKATKYGVDRYGLINVSNGYCAKGVADILIAGMLTSGVSFKRGNAHTWVEDGFGKTLKDFGWVLIGVGRQEPSDLEFGDICCCRRAGEHNINYGHISIYLDSNANGNTSRHGGQWFSDFRQKTWTVYNVISNESDQFFSEHFSYWRWPKKLMPDGKLKIMKFDVVESEESLPQKEVSEKDSSASGIFVNPEEIEGLPRTFAYKNYNTLDKSSNILHVDTINAFISKKTENDKFNERAALEVSEMLKKGGLVEGVDFKYTLAKNWSKELPARGWYKIGCGYPPLDVQAGDIMTVDSIHFNEEVEDLGYVAYFNGDNWVSENVQEGWFRGADVWEKASTVKQCYNYWRWPRRMYSSDGGVLVEDAISGTNSDICDEQRVSVSIPADYVWPIIEHGEVQKVEHTFNIDVLLDKINNNESEFFVDSYTSLGTAASAVVDLLINGGLKEGVSFKFDIADKWSEMLPKYGWVMISNGYVPKEEHLIPGDLMVISGLSNYKLGHVAMWIGNYWISDFNQGLCWKMFDVPDSKFTDGTTYTYWRWPRRFFNGVLDIDYNDDTAIINPDSSDDNTEVNYKDSSICDNPINIPTPSNVIESVIDIIYEETDVIFNIDKANAYVDSYVVNVKSHGLAVTSIVDILKEGGINTTASELVSLKTVASDSGKVLQSTGWSKIGTGYLPKDLLPGDIMVIGSTEKHELGHIAFWSGKNWVSDFKQDGWMVFDELRSEDDLKSHVSYWRWPRKIVNKEEVVHF